MFSHANFFPHDNFFSQDKFFLPDNFFLQDNFSHKITFSHWMIKHISFLLSSSSSARRGAPSHQFGRDVGETLSCFLSLSATASSNPALTLMTAILMMINQDIRVLDTMSSHSTDPCESVGVDGSAEKKNIVFFVWLGGLDRPK